MGGSKSINSPRRSDAKPQRSARVRFACQWPGFFSSSPAAPLPATMTLFGFPHHRHGSAPTANANGGRTEGGRMRRAPPLDVARDDWNAVVAGEAVTWAATSVGMTGRQSMEKQVLPCRLWLGPILGGASVSSHLCKHGQRRTPTEPFSLSPSVWGGGGGGGVPSPVVRVRVCVNEQDDAQTRI